MRVSGEVGGGKFQVSRFRVQTIRELETLNVKRET